MDENSDDNELASLTVKVPREYRKWWLIQARLRDETLTGVIQRLLLEEFGYPNVHSNATKDKIEVASNHH